ncbi:MAG: hypothetical protein ACE5R6_17950 [Candidatus Heimdallarchaeota archaeon]
MKNLEAMFKIGLVIDKVLFKKYKKDSLGKNIQELWLNKRWIAHRISPIPIHPGLRDDLTTFIPAVLTGGAEYDGNPVSTEMSYFLLPWRLRNYGGHNIEAQTVLVRHYEEIMKYLMSALFIAVETCL